MKKTIDLQEGRTLTLSSNAGWLFIYREQFGKDIVPFLIPVLNTGIETAFSIYQETGGKMDPAALMNLDPDRITSAFWNLGTIESVDLLNIIWAMAKNADPSTPEPRAWLDTFDEEFPLDIILPEAGKMIYKQFISSKNRQRLQTIMKTLEPLTSTK